MCCAVFMMRVIMPPAACRDVPRSEHSLAGSQHYQAKLSPMALLQTLLGSCLTHMNDIVERDVMAVIVYILRTADKKALDAHLSDVLCARLPQEQKVCIR